MKRKLLVILVLLSLVCGVFSADEQEERLFIQAEGRFKSGEYSQAIDLYDELINEYPHSGYLADSQYRKAVGLYRLGMYEQSLTLFGTIEIKYRSTRYIGYVPFWKGIIYYFTGDYEESIKQLKAFISVDPVQYADEAHQYLAMSQQARDLPYNAIETLEKLLGHKESDIDRGYPVTMLSALYLKTDQSKKCLDLLVSLDRESFGDKWSARLDLYLAEAYWENGDKTKGEEIYLTLLEKDLDIVSVVLSRLFTIYQGDGREEERDKILKTAEEKLAGKPEILSEFWLRVGISAYREDKKDIAEDYFLKAWESGISGSMSRLIPLYYSECLFEKGNAVKALNIIDSFLAEKSDSGGDLIYRKITYYWNEKDYQSLEKILPGFLENYPDDSRYDEAAYLYASVLVRLEKFSQADEFITGFEKSSDGGEYEVHFLRIKAIIRQRKGNFKEAIQLLLKYNPLKPDDVQARVDLIKLYYQTGDYTAVIIETESLFTDFTDLNKGYFKQYILVSYLKALAYIQNGSNESALSALKPVSSSSLEKAGYKVLYPYYLYYAGWAYYRTGNYGQAQKLFAELIARNDNPFPDKTAYLAGWSSFLNNDFASAEKFFSYVPDNSTSFVKDRSRFMYGKSLAAQKKYSAAETVFEGLSKEIASVFADDAMFEHAAVLDSLKKPDEAVDLYLKVYQEYPVSTLAEESMFRRGEVLYKYAKYAEARNAYREYRTAYPEGKLVDAALFWGGLSAYENKEEYSAALLWEKLLTEYPGSNFRAEAVYRTADIYAADGELLRAQDLYQTVILEYPEVASAIEAEKKLQNILYQQLGQGGRQDELKDIIKKEKESSTKKGREAMIELARIYFAGGNRSKVSEAVSMMEKIIAERRSDQEDSATANYILGDYYLNDGNPLKAENYFKQSLLLAGNDRDLAARAMNSLARTAVMTGNISAANNLLDQMEKQFGKLDWVLEAERILEGK